VAVRIDIRPRLTLRDEPKPKARRGFRLPPLTAPSVAYWIAMAGLTYCFAHLENPLASAVAAEPTPVVEPAAAPTSPPVLEAAPEPEPAPQPALASQAEALPSAEPQPTPTLAERDLTQPAERAPETRPERAPAAPPRAETAALTAPLPAPRLDFPEFTDSSRPRLAERASDGPRLDGLFERRGERDRNAQPAPPSAPDSDRDAPAVVTSCEAAIARNNEQLTIGEPRRGPVDVTRDQYAAILQDGRYLAGCSLPDRTVFEICAAVRDGRAVGITVTSNPPSGNLNGCVRRAVSRLKFPANPRLDVTHTRFDAAAR
jgi:hypothetical protein